MNFILIFQVLKCIQEIWKIYIFHLFSGFVLERVRIQDILNLDMIQAMIFSWEEACLIAQFMDGTDIKRTGVQLVLSKVDFIEMTNDSHSSFNCVA